MIAAAFAGAGILAIALGAVLTLVALTLFAMGGHWICLGYAILTQG